jgi:HEAT repeat protein
MRAWLLPDAKMNCAAAALAALEHLPAEDARPLAVQGLRHQRAGVRRQALDILSRFVDEESTRAIASVVGDSTASVRAAAATALTGRTSQVACGALLTLLRDGTDTSDARQYGYPDGPIEIEYGVAVAAATALGSLASWAHGLAVEVNAFLTSGGVTAKNGAIRRLLARRGGEKVIEADS